jgi:uracil-DNA glycosylase
MPMDMHLRDALEQARRTLPGWAYAVLAKAAQAAPGAEPAGGAEVGDDLGWLLKQGAAHGLPLAIAPLLDAAGPLPHRQAETACQLLTAARWALDHPGSLGVAAKATDGHTLVVGREVYPQVAHVVPTSAPSAGRDAPLVAFVGFAPSDVDKARGEALSGADGRVFVDKYLAPLGLTKADVLLTHVAAAEGGDARAWKAWVRAELEAARPQLVVALGKHAHASLGSLADAVLPHPSGVRKRGDWGEVERKIRKLRDQLDALATGTQHAVSISKQLAEKRIVYGVVLDPYQFDSQDDWIPPAEIEQTAHRYLSTSRVVGIQHQKMAEATVVESWLWPYPSSADYAAAMANEPHLAYRAKFGNQTVHSGSWLMGTRIDDAAVWEKVVAGEITAYSIGGFGQRTPIKPADTAMPKVTFVDVG